MKDIIELGKTFDEFRDEIEKSISLRDEVCSKHGNCKHSHCTRTGLSICIECLKERRFRKEDNES